MPCQTYLAYCAPYERIANLSSVTTGGTFHSTLWSPSLLSLIPCHSLPCQLWIRVFLSSLLRPKSNRSHILFLYSHGKLVHRCLLSTRSKRFSFMGANDLQIGATFTPPEFRGLGYATMAISLIKCYLPSTASLWYVCSASNSSSMRVAIKSGMKLQAKLNKTSFMGISLLGKYIHSP